MAERKTKLTTEVIERFTTMYKNSNVPMAEMEAEFGRKPGTLYRWAFELGLKRSRPKDEATISLELVHRYCISVSQELKPQVRLDLVHIPTTGKTLDFILWLSDLHAGRLTKSFNAVIFANRMQALAERIIQKVARYKPFYKIGKLHIFSLGDLVSGERIGHMVTLEELEHAVLTQIYGIAIPRLVQFTNRLLLTFGAIEVHAVPGNHGVTTYPAVSAVNWDTVVNYGWQAKMSNQPEVEFNIEAIKWYNLATVMGIDWLLVHGDQAKGGSPYTGLVSKVKDWHSALPESFDMVASAHFHHFFKVREIFGNATLVSDDEWSWRVVGREGDCGQLLAAVSSNGIEELIPIWLRDIVEEEE